MQAIRSLKLYHFGPSRSARAKWILHETVGDAFEATRVNLYAGEQYAPSYLEKNPNHNVPVLEITFEDGETMVMLESAAIVGFFADAYPEKRLAPPPGLSSARADYLQMLHFGGSTMDMILWQIRIHEHVLPPAERDQRTIDRYRKKLSSEIEPQLAARLGKHRFICGDDFSAADCVIGYNVAWARMYDQCKDDIFGSYMGALAERPAFRSAFSDAAGFSPEAPQRPDGKTKFTG